MCDRGRYMDTIEEFEINRAFKKNKNDCYMINLTSMEYCYGIQDNDGNK